MRAVPHAAPGSATWLQMMTASKVPAVVGVSPYTSPYALWRLMHGDVAPDPQTPEQTRGHLLEPVVLDWFESQHPDWTVVRARPGEPQQTFVHEEHQWQACTPDALAYDDTGELVGVVNAKTSATPWAWGVPGTDQVPMEYRVQGMWECDVTGAPRCFLPVLGAYLRFEEYVVEYDPDDAAWLRQQCAAFMDSLTAHQPPDLGPGHDSTVWTVRRERPDIDPDAVVELPAPVWAAYVDAVDAEAAVRTEKAAAVAAVLHVMGDARTATFGGHVIATRQARSGGVPYLVASKTLTKGRAA